MKEKFFIAYDFISNKRRAKFVKTIEKYGVRIQYSIFEFSLTKPRKIEMIAALKKEDFFSDSKEESIIIIPISKDFDKKIERYGSTSDALDRDIFFVC